MTITPADLASHGLIFEGATRFLPRHIAMDGAGKETFGPINHAELSRMMAMDAPSYNQAQPVTTPNAGIPALFTTFIDPEVVRVVMSPMRAEEIYGSRQMGTWTDSNVMFKVTELTGTTSAYGDFNENGRSDFNPNYPTRQPYLFQTFAEWGDREVAINGEANINALAEKNLSTANTIQRQHNSIAFYGVAGLENYGALNDPNLSAALTPTTKAAGGTGWSVAQPQEIVADIQLMFNQLQTQTGGNLETDDAMTLVISPQSMTWLVTTNVYNMNTKIMLAASFPGLKIKSAPELTSNGVNNAQLKVDKLEGIDTTEVGFNLRFQSHRMEMKSSSMRQKKSGGALGTLIRYPIAIASMTGI